MSIKIYISSTSGSTLIKKNQQILRCILDSKKIDYDEIDISNANNVDIKNSILEEIKKSNKSKPLPPHIFIDNEYLGDFDDLNNANELEDVEIFLRIPGAEEKKNEKEKSKAVKEDETNENKEEKASSIELAENSESKIDENNADESIDSVNIGDIPETDKKNCENDKENSEKKDVLETEGENAIKSKDEKDLNGEKVENENTEKTDKDETASDNKKEEATDSSDNTTKIQESKEVIDEEINREKVVPGNKSEVDKESSDVPESSEVSTNEDKKSEKEKE